MTETIDEQIIQGLFLKIKLCKIFSQIIYPLKKGSGSYLKKSSWLPSRAPYLLIYHTLSLHVLCCIIYIYIIWSLLIVKKLRGGKVKSVRKNFGKVNFPGILIPSSWQTS